MQTVGDVIEFWKNYCEKHADYLSDEQIYKGCDLIAEDPDVWCDRGMAKLRDEVLTISYSSQP